MQSNVDSRDGSVLSEGLGAGAEAKKRGVRHALRRMACALGWSTSYHVAATYNRDSHVGFSVVSMTVSVRPWLHADNYRDLVAYVQSQAVRPMGPPNITSVTKLGA
jgi:hypothetical protein